MEELSRKQRKKLEKQERNQAEREEKRVVNKSRRIKKNVTIFIAVLIIASLGYFWYTSYREARLFAVIPIASPHIDSLDQVHSPYNTYPPTSGAHIERHSGGKIFTEPIREEIQVHDLEHGAILIQYKCNECDDLIGQISAYTKEYDQVKVAPYPKQSTLITVTAWGKLVELKELDDTLIREFITSNVGKAHGK